MTTLSVVYQMLYGFDKYCNLKDIVYDVTEWCLSGNLSFELVGSNLMSKVFVITGSVNSLIGEIYNSSGDSDYKSAFVRFSTIGKDFGSIFAAILAYEAIPQNWKV